jgi:hypothetical protein
MRTLICLTLLVLPVTVQAGGGPVEPRATSLTLAEPAFESPQVVVATSMPPQFEITFMRDMPTPGWEHKVDSVTVDPETRRIVAKLTESRHGGTAAQVITPTKCRVPLGRLAPGRYLLELWMRRGADQPHTLAQALVVIAR